MGSPFAAMSLWMALRVQGRRAMRVIVAGELADGHLLAGTQIGNLAWL